MSKDHGARLTRQCGDGIARSRSVGRFAQHVGGSPDRHGFTLIELLVVISIIAVLMAPIRGRHGGSARLGKFSAGVSVILDSEMRVTSGRRPARRASR